ncbi:hypothetical protein Tco_1270857, partial [Tanacetum coccineum]
VKEVKDYLNTYSSAGMDISRGEESGLRNVEEEQPKAAGETSSRPQTQNFMTKRSFSNQKDTTKGPGRLAKKMDSDSNVEEYTRSSNKFLADLNAEFHDKALLSNQKRYYKRSGRVGSSKKPIDKTKETCFAYGKLVPLKDKGVTKVKAFLAIAEEEPFIGKNDAKSGQWVKITIKKKMNLKEMKSDLKKLIKKWTSTKVTLDQLLNEQVPSNIVRAIGGRGKKKDTISLKKVLFYKTIKFPSETIPEITSDSESECGNLEPLPSVLKLIGSEPIGTSTDVLTLTDLSMTPAVSEEIKKVLHKRSAVKAPKKKAQTMSPSASDSIPVKKADSSTEKLLLTLLEEVKAKDLVGPCKHCGFRNYLFEDSYMKPKCSTCGSTNHLTKEHPEQADVRKTLAKLKAQSSQGSSSRKAPMIPKPFNDCKYCDFNNHHSDECEYYPGGNIYGRIAHETAKCTKKPASTKRKQRISSQQSNVPTKKWVHKRN